MAKRDRTITIPLGFEEALSDLLKVKPPPKPEKQTGKTGKAREGDEAEGGEEAMIATLIAVSFWVGAVRALLDWRYVRKGGIPPTPAEKRYLKIALALSVATLPILSAIGAPQPTTARAMILAVAVTLNVWTIRRAAIRRATSSRGLSKT